MFQNHHFPHNLFLIIFSLYTKEKTPCEAVSSLTKSTQQSTRAALLFILDLKHFLLTGNPLFLIFWLVIASTKKALEGFPNLFLGSECIWQFRHFIENCLWQGGGPRLTLYYRTPLFWTKIQHQFSYVCWIVDRVKMFLWFKNITINIWFSIKTHLGLGLVCWRWLVWI